MYQKCDEAIILDILANTDNNVQKACEQLKQMGYEKRETPSAPKVSNRVANEKQIKRMDEPTPPPKIKTAEEKKKCKQGNFNRIVLQHPFFV
jgi:hypothetical protein